MSTQMESCHDEWVMSRIKRVMSQIWGSYVTYVSAHQESHYIRMSHVTHRMSRVMHMDESWHLLPWERYLTGKLGDDNLTACVYCVCVCVHVRVCMCMCACACVCGYVCIYFKKHVYDGVHSFDLFFLIFFCTFHLLMHTHIHALSHTHMHPHTYTHTQVPFMAFALSALLF